MFKFCDVFHWRIGTSIKLLTVDHKRVEVPKHGMNVKLISFEPPKIGIYNLKVNNSGMYRCYCESGIGEEYTTDIGILVRPKPSSQESNECDSTCSTCIIWMIVPFGSIVVVMLIIILCLLLYYNRFRIIFNCKNIL
uniref:ORF56 n=1 Tax=Pacific black duck aviadenovirus TaxID=2798287 RepID=A0A7T4S0A9_9ADEN|nr:ORF56 [Pacific black duck aviadenovirus]